VKLHPGLAVGCALLVMIGAALPAAAKSIPSIPVSQLASVRGSAGFTIKRAQDVVETTTSVARPALPFRRHSSAPVGRTPAVVTPNAPTAIAAPKSPKIAIYNNTNFPGISALDNGSLQGSPPDTTGAIGPADYVEMVNEQIAVYARNNLMAAVSGPISVQSFVGAGTNVSYCDVQVQWDPDAGRWFYLFLFCNASNFANDIHFGWSKTANPEDLATGWCHFIGVTNNLLWDYPKLGHNRNYFIVGANAYDTTNGVATAPFSTAEIAWIIKPNSAQAAACTFPASSGSATTPLLNGDGHTQTFTPVPVNTMTSADDGYVISAYDPSGPPVTTQSKLAVWHVDAAGTLHQDADVLVSPYTVPFPAPQMTAPVPLDTLDGRLTQAVGDPVTGMWTQHTVDGAGSRSVVRWYEISIVSSVTSLTQEGTVASGTDFVFNGSISPRSDAQGAAVFYNRSSSTILPVAAGQIRLASTTAGTMEPGELVLVTSASYDHDGSCNFGGSGSCRWGDYSGASPDPINPSVVWGSNQWIFAQGTNRPSWSTENYAVLVALAPHAPAPVTAVASDIAATVSWTPSAFDPGTPTTSYTVDAYVGASLVKSIVVAAPATSMYFSGLYNGITYTFTVIATDPVGSSPESAHSSAVTPSRIAAQPGPAPGATSRVAISQAPPHTGPLPR
jgi:hypothetical protein